MFSFSGIKVRYENWKKDRILKNHGCRTWEEYYHRTDSLHDSRAHTVAKYYHGYKYVYRCENPDHFAYQCVVDDGAGDTSYGYDKINKWCADTIIDRYRVDFLRVRRMNAIGLDGSTVEEWWLNEIGGHDYIFYAFTSERDYIVFLLKWT